MLEKKTIKSIKAGAKGAGFMGAVGGGTIGVGLGANELAGRNGSFDSAAKALTGNSKSGNGGLDLWNENTVMSSSAPIAPLGSNNGNAFIKMAEDRAIRNRAQNPEEVIVESSGQTPHEVEQFLDNHQNHEVTVTSKGEPSEETSSVTSVRVKKATAKVILDILKNETIKNEGH